MKISINRGALITILLMALIGFISTIFDDFFPSESTTTWKSYLGMGIFLVIAILSIIVVWRAGKGKIPTIDWKDEHKK